MRLASFFVVAIILKANLFIKKYYMVHINKTNKLIILRTRTTKQKKQQQQQQKREEEEEEESRTTIMSSLNYSSSTLRIRGVNYTTHHSFFPEVLLDSDSINQTKDDGGIGFSPHALIIPPPFSF
jgi:hypothetical protein